MSRPVLGIDPEVLAFLEALGVASPGNTQRIIVDIPTDGPVKLYVTYPADGRGFDLRFQDGDFEIVTIDKAVGLRRENCDG